MADCEVCGADTERIAELEGQVADANETIQIMGMAHGDVEKKLDDAEKAHILFRKLVDESHDEAEKHEAVLRETLEYKSANNPLYKPA